MLLVLGIIAAESHQDYQGAAVLFREALSIFQDVGHRYGEILILHNLGGVRVDMGDYQAAEADLRQVIDIAEATGWGDLSATYDFLSQAYLGQDKVSDALAAARQALELGQETEAQEDIGKAWRALGMVLAHPSAPESVTIQEDVVDARTSFAQSVQVFAEASMEGERARTLQAWARYEMERGDKARGEELEQEAQDVWTQLGIEL